MSPTYSKIGGTTMCEGPCVVCGMRNYSLSMGGPHICPACDCGVDPKDSRHPVNRMKLDSAEPLKQPVLMPASRDELLLAALEACLRELQQLNASSASITLLLGQVVNRLEKGYEPMLLKHAKEQTQWLETLQMALGEIERLKK